MVNHETDKRFVAVIVVVFESNIVADTFFKCICQ